eukprot:366130-Chlamydomonas_euryale.AAC.72
MEVLKEEDVKPSGRGLPDFTAPESVSLPWILKALCSGGRGKAKQRVHRAGHHQTVMQIHLAPVEEGVAILRLVSGLFSIGLAASSYSGNFKVSLWIQVIYTSPENGGETYLYKFEAERSMPWEQALDIYRKEVRPWLLLYCWHVTSKSCMNGTTVCTRAWQS